MKNCLYLLLICLLWSNVHAQKKQSVDFWKSPMTSVQFNLQVKDTRHVRPDALFKFAKDSLYADAIMFNAGGAYAWYPTKVPFHHMNPFMEGRDLLGEASAAAKKYDLKLLARVDWSRMRDVVYPQKPDWFAVDAAGYPQTIGEPRYGSWGLLYHTCASSPYRNEAVALPALKEIIQKYKVDAFFFSFANNAPSWSAYAQKDYYDFYGKTLPSDSDQWASDFKERVFQKNWNNFYQTIKATNPDVAVIGRLKMNQRAHLEHMMAHCDVISSQPRDDFHEGWKNQEPHWWSAIETNFAQSISEAGERPLVLTNTGLGLAWRHLSLPDAEYQFWMSQIIANGGNVLHSATGVPETMEDHRTLKNIARFNQTYRKVQPYLYNNIKMAETAVVISRRNTKTQRDELYGFFEALMNHQVQFNVIPEHFLTAEKLKKYKTLILPHINKMEAAHIEAIKTWSKKGGKLIASYQVATHNEKGETIREFPFRTILGVDAPAQHMTNQYTSYIRLEKDNVLSQNIHNTHMIAGAENIAVAHPEKATMALSLIGPFAVKGAEGNPPERINLPTPHTQTPIATTYDGHVFFANQIGKLVWTYRLPEHQDLIANAVQYAQNGQKLINIDHHGVHATLFQQGKKRILHLVNAVGTRPLQDITPLHQLKITLGIKGNFNTARTVIGEKKLSLTKENGAYVLTLDRLDTYEVIVLE